MHTGIIYDEGMEVLSQAGIAPQLANHTYWPRLLAQFENGEVDILVNSVWTEDRAKTHLYSEPWFEMPFSYLVRSDDYDRILAEGLSGKKIAIIRAAKEFETAIEKLRETGDVVFVASYKRGLRQLANGQFDALMALFGDYNISSYTRNMEAGAQGIKFKLIVPDTTGIDVRMLFRKNSECASRLPVINTVIADTLEERQARILEAVRTYVGMHKEEVLVLDETVVDTGIKSFADQALDLPD
ncbi:hypothetical protein GCM10017044_01140 [Kordiimonas sediminis]|uniref:Solute-binding protein family 3/N-terminal domain-containing protein n=2 Tax=Kordiimonas sediminis TaxID=1735581 RepID=A0A919AJ87_9PROT|nr:hypothetical protein GCM10017044_01140 [Kordiimonas sediminis]